MSNATDIILKQMLNVFKKKKKKHVALYASEMFKGHLNPQIASFFNVLII